MKIIKSPQIMLYIYLLDITIQHIECDGTSRNNYLCYS